MVGIGDSVLFTIYCCSTSAIIINLCRSKLQDDYHEEIKKLREYNLNEDKLKPNMFETYG